jgi:hypothetical protein
MRLEWIDIDQNSAHFLKSAGKERFTAVLQRHLGAHSADQDQAKS